jgi:hypothetical protein
MFAVEVRGLRKTYVSGWFRKRKKEALINDPEPLKASSKLSQSP